MYYDIHMLASSLKAKICVQCTSDVQHATFDKFASMCTTWKKPCIEALMGKTVPPWEEARM
jgi:hypothetical protein